MFDKLKAEDKELLKIVVNFIFLCLLLILVCYGYSQSVKGRNIKDSIAENNYFLNEKGNRCYVFIGTFTEEGKKYYNLSNGYVIDAQGKAYVPDLKNIILEVKDG